MAKHLLLTTLLAAAMAFGLAMAGNDPTPTAYEMLERYDFPRGILPEGVQSYLLRDDGSFEVYFAGDCEFRVANKYVIRYNRRIAGTVQAGSLKSLEGVSVKILFLWIGVNEVDRSGDQLRFYVGPLSASFPLYNFAASPRCRCGFDCSGAGGCHDRAVVAAS